MERSKVMFFVNCFKYIAVPSKEDTVQAAFNSLSEQMNAFLLQQSSCIQQPQRTNERISSPTVKLHSTASTNK